MALKVKAKEREMTILTALGTVSCTALKEIPYLFFSLLFGVLRSFHYLCSR